MSSGNFKTELSRPRLHGCWKLEIGNCKLTEIRLAKQKMNQGIKRHKGGAEKRRNLREHCGLTVKNAANRLIYFQYQVQLQGWG